MIYVIAIVALLASILTFVSGFGLGTLLLPVFSLFFPIEIAVGITATVHLLNNLFKFGLLYKAVNRTVFLRFGLPGIIGAFAGAKLLAFLGDMPELYLGDLVLNPIKMSVGFLMIFFALTELVPNFLTLKFGKKALPVGGLISGFFGGFSGHQGALRSMFLIKLGLEKQVYVATGVAIALLVDFTRIPLYLQNYPRETFGLAWPSILAATLAAFLGAIIGKKLLPKITLRAVHIVVGLGMIAMGIALFFNWL